MSYYDELDKVLAMTRDRPAGLIPRKSGIDFPRDSEGERLSLSSDPPKKPRLSAHATTPNPRHCESDGKGESSGEQKKGKKSRKRPRSEGSRKRRVAINCKKLRSKIIRKRSDDCRNRAAFHQGLMPLSAPVCFFPEQLLAKDRRCSKVVREFYASHGESNRYLTVSEGANVSNPSGVKGGGKGVFARTDIPKGTLVCPYLGKLRAKHCPAVDLCQYDMLTCCLVIGVSFVPGKSLTMWVICMITGRIMVSVREQFLTRLPVHLTMRAASTPSPRNSWMAGPSSTVDLMRLSAMWTGTRIQMWSRSS